MKKIPRIINGVPIRIGTVCILNHVENSLSYEGGYRTAHMPIIIGIDNQRLSDLIHYYFVEQLHENILDLSSHSRAFLTWVKWLQNNKVDPFVTSPIPKFHPTRGFRNHLVETTKSETSECPLATSTASTYINHIKNFYKLLDQIGVVKASDFFQKEKSIVNTNIVVETSDLSIPRVSTKEKSLNPFREKELVAFNTELIKESTEFQLMCRFLLFSGLRLQEMLTLPRSLFTEERLVASERSLIRGLMIGRNINDVRTKFGKNRELFVTRQLYEDVLDYLLDEKVEKRISRWRTKHGDRQKNEPLFITNKGTSYSSESFYSRWYPFISRLRKSSQLPFKHKPHDCRATFGTSYIQVATKKCDINITEALGSLKVWMGHKQLSTTVKYIKFIEQQEVSNVVAEVMDNLIYEASMLNMER